MFFTQFWGCKGAIIFQQLQWKKYFRWVSLTLGSSILIEKMPNTLTNRHLGYNSRCYFFVAHRQTHLSVEAG
jgi:hypothetical protein